MHAHLIFWPMLAVLAIPIFVLLLNAKRKAVVAKAGAVDKNAAINDKAWPLPVLLTSNALANQFQLPIIFYVLCLINFNINAVSAWLVYLAWAFAVLRWIHVLVHVTTNYIPLRMGFFLLSGLILLAMFVCTLMAMANL